MFILFKGRLGCRDPMAAPLGGGGFAVGQRHGSRPLLAAATADGAGGIPHEGVALGGPGARVQAQQAVLQVVGGPGQVFGDLHGSQPAGRSYGCGKRSHGRGHGIGPAISFA